MAKFAWLVLIALCVYNGLYFAAAILIAIPIAVSLGATYAVLRMLGVFGGR